MRRTGTGRARVGVLGGTFDHLHAGHRSLLDEAFRRAERVGIGVTTATYLRQHTKEAADRVQPFRRRRAGVVSYLRGRYPAERWWIVPLRDAVGGALQPDVELLIASADTRAGAQRVNALRRARGLRPVGVRLVPVVLADDLLVLSSTRIRRGVVDGLGRRRRPVRFARPAGLARSLRAGLERAARATFPPNVRVRWVDRRVAGSPARIPSPSSEAARILGDADYAVAVSRRAVGRGSAAALRLGFADAQGPVGPSARRSGRPSSVAAQFRSAFRARRARWVGRRR